MPPSIEQLTKWATHDQQYWAPRNERMRRHHSLYRVHRSKAPEGQLLIYGNDPKVLIEKLAATTARREHRIEVPPRGEANADAAQRIENGIRWWRTDIRRAWQRGLHNPLDYDEALSLYLRGWLTERMMLAPNTPSFTNLMLFEPSNIFPHTMSNGIGRTWHIYTAARDEILSDFPEAKKLLDDYADDARLEVKAYYENAAVTGDTFWHAVLVNNEFIKQPVDLGYWPWLMQVAKGAFSQHPRGWEDDDQIAAEVGMGFLDSIEDAYWDKNRVLTMLANTLAKQENPPKAVFTQDGRVVEMDLSTGGTTALVLDEKVQVLDIGPKAATMIPLLTSFQDQLNKGGLPSVMFGEGINIQSGYMGAVMQASAEDTLWSFVNALSAFKQARYEKFLELYSRFAPIDTGMQMLSMGKAGSTKGRYAWGEEMTVADIQANGTYVDVIYEDIAPRDRVALANIAAMLVKEKIIDLATARDKYLGLDDPGLINDKVLAELVYLNEDVVKVLSKIKLAELNKIPELKAILDAEREAQAMAELKAQQQGAMRAPGIGPVGEQGQMSPEVLPSVMQTGQPVEQNPQLAQLAALVNQP